MLDVFGVFDAFHASGLIDFTTAGDCASCTFGAGELVAGFVPAVLLCVSWVLDELSLTAEPAVLFVNEV